MQALSVPSTELSTGSTWRRQRVAVVALDRGLDLVDVLDLVRARRVRGRRRNRAGQRAGEARRHEGDDDGRPENRKQLTHEGHLSPIGDELRRGTPATDRGRPARDVVGELLRLELRVEEPARVGDDPQPVAAVRRRRRRRGAAPRSAPAPSRQSIPQVCTRYCAQTIRIRFGIHPSSPQLPHPGVDERDAGPRLAPGVVAIVRGRRRAEREPVGLGAEELEVEVAPRELADPLGLVRRADDRFERRQRAEVEVRAEPRAELVGAREPGLERAARVGLGRRRPARPRRRAAGAPTSAGTTA